MLNTTNKELNRARAKSRAKKHKSTQIDFIHKQGYTKHYHDRYQHLFYEIVGADNLSVCHVSSSSVPDHLLAALDELLGARHDRQLSLIASIATKKQYETFSLYSRMTISDVAKARSINQSTATKAIKELAIKARKAARNDAELRILATAITELSHEIDTYRQMGGVYV